MEEDKEFDEGYSDETRQKLEENDEIDELEEGFMQGYENDNLAECSQCKKVLEDDIVEKEFDGDLYRFCSEKCADDFEKESHT